MKITIVGAGNVGRALATGWKQAGHDVLIAVRNPAGERAKALAAEGYRVAPMNATNGADVIVLAVPWGEIENVILALGNVSGSIIVDATNPLTKEFGLALGHTDSAGETVARLAKGARVVKAFNTTGAENMANARSFPVKPLMAMASDDAQAKSIVAKLAEDLGFEAMDAGPLLVARYLEPMAMVWITKAYAGGAGTNFAFAVTRR